MVLKKTLEHPLGFKEIQPVHPKGNQSWGFLERIDAVAETPMLWPPDTKNWLIWKDPLLGKIEGGKRREWQRKRWLDGITDSVEWVWVNSRSWWWTGRPDVLQSMGSQRVRHDWATELTWTKYFLDGELCNAFETVFSGIQLFNMILFYSPEDSRKLLKCFKQSLCFQHLDFENSPWPLGSRE